MQDSRAAREECIILGDLNAKSPQWGSLVIDLRREYLVEWLATLDMVVHNTGETPTFCSESSQSFIDVTCSTSKIAREIDEWRVIDDESLSDHRLIYFEVKGGKTSRRRIERSKVENDWEAFRATVEWKVENAEDTVVAGTQLLKEAFEDSQIQRGPGIKALVPYWWNHEIEEQRKKCTKARRMMTRANRNEANGELSEERKKEYKVAKRDLRNLINSSKRKHWQELCEELDKDIWGDGYRIVTGKLTNRMPMELTLERKRQIATVLFPKRKDEVETVEEVMEVNLFTLEELNEAVKCLKVGKAPGLDSIPTEAIKEAVKVAPIWMLSMLNKLLRNQSFPAERNIAKLILIPKRGKPLENPSAYRPICLLNTLSKLYECLIRKRLEEELEEGEGLTENQYGFRKGRSTIQAIEAALNKKEESREKWCALITLDVKNAFNTATWSIILRELRRRNTSQYLINIIVRYFNERKILLANGEEIDVTAGVPQGSVLGPTLWNILYDGVLRLKLTEGANQIGFADDLALIVNAADEEELIYRANESLRRIDVWMENHLLELSPEKTGAVVIKGTRKREDIRFTLRKCKIIPGKSVRYLGVTIDTRCTFGEHMKKATKKAEERVSALKIMPNVGGPRSSKRQLLCGVVHSIELYAAPIWHKVLRWKKYRSMLEEVQRKMLLRVACAYRTISTKAVQVITGTIPIELLAKERYLLYQRENGNSTEGKKAVREVIVQEWQRVWEDITEVGQWTKRLLPNLKIWLQCGHRCTDYFLTQVLSGHGCFKHFIQRISKAEDDDCMYCGIADTAEHTLFHCSRWERDRQKIYSKLGFELTVENLVPTMTKNKSAWNIVIELAREIMGRKEKGERTGLSVNM